MTTYAEELIQEGERKGRLEGRVAPSRIFCAPVSSGR